MIKVKVSNNQVKINKKVYHSFNDKTTLMALIIHLISIAKSGSGIELSYGE